MDERQSISGMAPEERDDENDAKPLDVHLRLPLPPSASDRRKQTCSTKKAPIPLLLLLYLLRLPLGNFFSSFSSYLTLSCYPSWLILSTSSSILIPSSFLVDLSLSHFPSSSLSSSILARSANFSPSS